MKTEFAELNETDISTSSHAISYAKQSLRILMKFNFIFFANDNCIRLIRSKIKFTRDNF
jgi:hypothetical protein